LSALAALVLLAIALVRIVSLPELETQIEAFGLVVRLRLSTDLVLIGLASAVTVTGADWMVRSHPLLQGVARRYDHLVLPGLWTLASGVVLTALPEGPGLWLGLPLTAALLLAVLVAEFIVVDPEDPRAEAASLALRALGIAFLAISLAGILGHDTRAIFAVPAALVSGSAVAWRALRLRGPTRRAPLYALLVGTVIAQLAWALHYSPVSPLQGAILLAVAGYFTLGAVEAHAGGQLTLRRALEYGGFAVAGLLAALFLM
jgi:Protein of unknown function (DUF5656)